MKRQRFIQIDRRNGRMLNVVVGVAPNLVKIPIYSDILKSTSLQLRQRVQALPTDCEDLVIRDIPAVVMETLIEYICKTFGRGKTELQISDSSVYQLISASIKLGLEDVERLCEEHFKRMEVTNENCLGIFVKTKNWTRISSEKKQQALDFLLAHLDQLVSQPSFLRLKIKHLITLIKGGEGGIKCSMEMLLDGAGKWLRFNGKQSQIESHTLQILAQFPMEQHKKSLMETLHSVNPALAQKLAYDFMVRGKTAANSNLNPIPIPIPIPIQMPVPAPSSASAATSAPQAIKRANPNTDDQNSPGNKKPLPKGVESYRQFWCPFCPHLSPTPSARQLTIHLKTLHLKDNTRKAKTCSLCSLNQIFTPFDWMTHITDCHSQWDNLNGEFLLENNDSQGQEQADLDSKVELDSHVESQVENQGHREEPGQKQQEEATLTKQNSVALSRGQIGSGFSSSLHPRSVQRACPLRFKK